MKKLFILGVLLLSAAAAVQSQDIHFSQYHNSPLTLNPALTATMNGKYRVGAIYRNQWWAAESPGNLVNPTYQTYSLFYDMKFAKDRLEPNVFGMGIMLFSDDAGDGALTTQSAMLSAAYHQAVDRFGQSSIGFSLQAGYTQKRVFIYDLTFESQLEDNGFNTNIYHGEAAFTGKPIGYPDVNIGALFKSGRNENFKYYFGVGIHHVARPNESFLQDRSNRLDPRYTFHLGSEISLGEYAYLAPSFLYMRQSNAQQFNFGAAYNYEATDEWTFFGGAWYRLKDAIIAQLGAQWKGLKGTVSYDINSSGLRLVTRTQGSLEASVIYAWGDDPRSRRYDGFCPSF